MSSSHLMASGEACWHQTTRQDGALLLQDRTKLLDKVLERHTHKRFWLKSPSGTAICSCW